jgi:hypothetical protein
MQRTGTLLTVALALLVVGSLFFVGQYLGVARRPPPASLPGLPPVSEHASQREADARRSPTVLSPDSVADEIPNVVSRASHDAAGQYTAGDTEILTEPVVTPYLRPPDVPVRLLPMRESLVPIPGPYESAPALGNDAEAGRLSERLRQDRASR